MKNNMIKNVSLSIFAQIISLFVALVLNLIVPKFISQIDYALWQTYVLYASYVGILHFGIFDGLMLRYSQYDYNQLNKDRISSQFQLIFFSNIFFSIILIIFSLFYLKNGDYLVWFMVALAIVSKNLFTYNSYLFQMTNRINKYAQLVIIQKICYGFFVIICLIFNIHSFIFFCIADIFGDILSSIISVKANQGLYFKKNINFKEMVYEAKLNFDCGIKLLIATWSSMLLVGGAKLIVQWHWDKLTFGKVSFSFSVTTLFLTFVTAISIVLFPSLKRMKQEELPTLYKKIRGILSPLLIFMLVCYFPGAIILKNWLPMYGDSINYLGILLPTIIYTSKVSLLTNNYLKAYRKEKSLVLINVFSVICAFLGYFICAYVFNNIYMLFIWVLFTIMMRSILSEIIVAKIIHINLNEQYLIEFAMTIVFVLCVNIENTFIGMLIYFFIYCIYFIINLKEIKGIIKKIKV